MIIQALAYACKVVIYACEGVIHADTGHLHLLYAVLSKRGAYDDMRSLSADMATDHACSRCMCGGDF